MGNGFGPRDKKWRYMWWKQAKSTAPCMWFCGDSIIWGIKHIDPGRIVYHDWSKLVYNRLLCRMKMQGVERIIWSKLRVLFFPPSQKPFIQITNTQNSNQQPQKQHHPTMSDLFDDHHCPICMETIDDDHMELSCCRSKFCRECLENWKPGFENCVSGRRTCLCCRARIPPTLEDVQSIVTYELIVDRLLRYQSAPSQVREAREYLWRPVTRYMEAIERFHGFYGPSPVIILTSRQQQPDTLPMELVNTAVGAGRNRETFIRETFKFLGRFPIPLARTNATSKDGNTLLHLAVQLGEFFLTDFLLTFGANVNARNVNGKTPIRFVGNNRLIAELLLADGASSADYRRARMDQKAKFRTFVTNWAIETSSGDCELDKSQLYWRRRWGA
mmetsp:Transcript_10130/g.24183  ORF Transcript_10130/g.24183 Transcript_10130/m.24183 type:complete len:387 (+) Transcript_10130:657-1817(+)